MRQACPSQPPGVPIIIAYQRVPQGEVVIQLGNWQGAVRSIKATHVAVIGRDEHAATAELQGTWWANANKLPWSRELLGPRGVEIGVRQRLAELFQPRREALQVVQSQRVDARYVKVRHVPVAVGLCRRESHVGNPGGCGPSLPVVVAVGDPHLEVVPRVRGEDPPGVARGAAAQLHRGHVADHEAVPADAELGRVALWFHEAGEGPPGAPTVHGALVDQLGGVEVAAGPSPGLREGQQRAAGRA
mmetsp:Transcript_38145/g.102428  ORF Transcript_38145/g.102428 Transcript_38145/m.102428 type:complete len:245 (+) Transcript_38145:582-1316(+)